MLQDLSRRYYGNIFKGNRMEQREVFLLIPSLTYLHPLIDKNNEQIFVSLSLSYPSVCMQASLKKNTVAYHFLYHSWKTTDKTSWQ